MATNFINNLSNTYQQSPSLQNQFATEQDYLDLFDKNQVTPQMAQAFNINDYEFEDQDQGIKSIINTAAPIINPGGDNDNRPPSGPTDLGITSDNFGLGLDDQTGMGYELTDKDRSDINKQKTKNTAMGLMAALSFAFNPVGFFIGRYAKDKYKDYKEKKEKERIEQEKKDAQAAKDNANAYDYEGRSNKQGTHYSTKTNKEAQANQDRGRGKSSNAGMSSSARGAAMHGARGGFVPTGLSRGSYFKGGIVSLRRR